MTPEKITQARKMREAGESFEQIAKVLSVGKSSVARALSRYAEQRSAPTP